MVCGRGKMFIMGRKSSALVNKIALVPNFSGRVLRKTDPRTPQTVIPCVPSCTRPSGTSRYIVCVCGCSC